jgi:hypothetical protein
MSESEVVVVAGRTAPARPHAAGASSDVAAESGRQR